VSWLEFISSMTGALAWPLVIAVVVVSFRKSIARLLPDLRRLKAGPTGLEMEWERKLEEVREELEGPGLIEEQKEIPSAVTPEGQEVTPSPSFLTEIGELARVSPTAAVLESYRRLEAVLRRAISERHPDLPERFFVTIGRLIDQARRDGLIGPAENSALQDLRGMRNILAHGMEAPAIDYEQAMEYAQLVEQVIVRIETSDGKREEG